MISIVIPTISARAHWLERVQAAYEATTPGDYELHVRLNRPTCGVAWNEGIRLARGDYIHLTADDCEPLPGWAEAAMASADAGELPSARILNSDGTLQSCGTDHREHPEGSEAYVARIPFATREQMQAIGPILDVHYMTDYWFSHRGRQLGYRSIVRRDYCFIHHFAQEGRLDERLWPDVAIYKQAGGQ